MNKGFVTVPECEAATIGCMLLDPATVDEVLAVVNAPEAFTEKTCRQTFKAIQELHTAGQPVDITTVSAKVSNDVFPSQISGFTNAVATSANVDCYAQEVLNAWLVRQAHDAARRIMAMCGDDAHIGNVLDTAEAAFLNIAEKRFQDEHAALADIVDEVKEHLHAQAHGQVGRGVPTGIQRLDDLLTGGLQHGALNVVAARPSVGKTALALQFAYQAATHHVPVLFFSLEMSKSELFQRLLAHAGGVDVTALRRGYSKTDNLERLDTTADALGQLPIWIDDGSSLTPERLRSAARLHQKRHGKSLIVCDYVQLLHTPQGNRRDRHLELGEISRALKATARELEAPVLACAQLSRQAEHESSGFKMLATLRESGSIEQDADAVIILRRLTENELDALKNDHGMEFESNIIKLTLAKHRNGPTGEMALQFNAERQLFSPP